MKQRLIVILSLVMFGFTLATFAQQQNPNKPHVTPVKPSTNKVLKPEKGTDDKIIERYVLGDTAAALEEIRKDSLKRVYPHYPKLTDVAFGINIADPLLMAFGQKYASIDLSATLNMWNRLQPVVELGLGWANSTPDDMNFTYRGKPSPFVRLGANYNFLFKSDPKYQFYAGLRLGFSYFNYDITDITYHDGYWGEDVPFAIKGQHSHALWGSLVAGMRVHVWGNISAGWQVRYQGIFNYKKNVNSKPWFVPGYGVRDRKFAFGFSIYYTLPLMRDRWPVKESKDSSQPKSDTTQPVPQPNSQAQPQPESERPSHIAPLNQ